MVMFTALYFIFFQILQITNIIVIVMAPTCILDTKVLQIYIKPVMFVMTKTVDVCVMMLVWSIRIL